MQLNIPKLECVVEKMAWDTLEVKNKEGDTRILGRATFKCEMTISRVKSLALLSKLKVEQAQGQLNSIMTMLLDLRMVKTLKLDLEFPKNEVQVSVDGEFGANIGSDLKVGSWKLSRYGDDDVTWKFTIHGSMHSDALYWLNENPLEAAEFKITGPGVEPAPEQTDLTD